VGPTAKATHASVEAVVLALAVALGLGPIGAVGLPAVWQVSHASTLIRGAGIPTPPT
jgi:hypothetical protein